MKIYHVECCHNIHTYKSSQAFYPLLTISFQLYATSFVSHGLVYFGCTEQRLGASPQSCLSSSSTKLRSVPFIFSAMNLLNLASISGVKWFFQSPVFPFLMKLPRSL